MQIYHNYANEHKCTTHFYESTTYIYLYLLIKKSNCQTLNLSLFIFHFSIFARVNITNPRRRLVKFDVISCYIHLQVNITKQKFSKWWLPVLWKFTDKEISEIKINSISKNTKACEKILKQLFASGSVIIGEYSPRLRLGEYSPIITSPSANNC